VVTGPADFQLCRNSTSSIGTSRTPNTYQNNSPQSLPEQITLQIPQARIDNHRDDVFARSQLFGAVAGGVDVGAGGDAAEDASLWVPLAFPPESYHTDPHLVFEG
jgi:hypothetical protein